MGTLMDVLSPEQHDDSLNTEQRRAVEHGEGPLVVIAGAGTGKTRVIVERIRRLLETRADLTAGEILALTYTRKAAGEMAWRVRKEMGERAKGLVATTFHAFCHERLEEENPGLRLIDDVEHWILLRRNLARLGLVHFRRLYDPGQFLNDFTKFFSRCQDELVTAEEYLRYAQQQAARLAAGADDEAREDAEKQLELARAYTESERLLSEENLLTFGASLVETVRRLERDAAACEALRRRFRFILVDEFQDTNVAQIRLLGLLAGEPRNLFVVGDDDQAIYRFRGASFGSFRIFERDFLPPAAAPPARDARLLLSQNYRSTKKILRLAGAVIRNNGAANRMFPGKQLTTANPEGDRIRIAGLPSEQAEADWVAAQIEEEHARGRPWSGFAVLYRTHAHREHLVAALDSRGIPFVIRNLSVLSHPVVRDLLAALAWLDWPGDNVACARVLAIPRWGFTPEDLVRIGQRAAKHPRKSLWDALGAGDSGEAAEKVGEAAAELIQLHVRLHEMARRVPLLAVFNELAMGLGMLPLATERDRRAFAAFLRFLQEWQAARPGGGLHEFLEYFRYFQQAGGSITLDEKHRAGEITEADAGAQDVVQLMTVHAAKGLEFDHVFVIRLCRNSFPVRNRRPTFEFPDALMKEELPQGDHHILEERRLFYVALTRARKRLTLTTLVRDRSKPSPFLEDIEQEMALLAKDVERLAPDMPRAPAASTSHAAGKEAGESPELRPARAPGAAASSNLFPDDAGHAYDPSRIGAWAAAYRPPVGSPLELSDDAIELYQSCPQKFLFERSWRLRGKPHAAITFGSLMHSVIKHFIREVSEGRKPSLEDLLTLYDREWKSVGFEDDYQEESYRRDGREWLRKFHARVCAAPPVLRDQEKTFSLPLANDVVLTGRLDQVNRLPGGGFEIVDYKTGTPRDEKHAKKSLQLTYYALAARDALELGRPRMALHYLKNDTVVISQREDKDIAEAEAILQEVAAEIRAAHFPAKPGFNCRFCDYRLICPAHERGQDGGGEAAED
ncbi:MAG TPA: ATP-dependent DNA helicase [Candidatus Acidoferrales bacterium]|nr:ATP-dependent DNA helicase [Candidatus Acidoferrales bacterium]